MKKQTKMAFLIGWFIVCTALYFTAVKLEFTPIMPIYTAMSLIFGITFFLVNGGVRPIVKTDKSYETEDSLSKKQKARMRYHKENALPEVHNQAERPNIFKLSAEKQKLYAEVSLILFLVPTVILAIDYLLIAFIPQYN